MPPRACLPPPHMPLMVWLQHASASLPPTLTCCSSTLMFALDRRVKVGGTVVGKMMPLQAGGDREAWHEGQTRQMFSMAARL